MERLRHFSKTSGIYKIQSIVNGKIYVGSAVNLKKRKYDHIHFLSLNEHGNSRLQNHYSKYGITDLQFIILEYCAKENLIEREQYYIDTLHLFDENKKALGFNLNPTAGSQLGFKHKESSKQKYSISMKSWYNTIGGIKDKETKRNRFLSSTNPMKDPLIAKEHAKNMDYFVRGVIQYDLNGDYVREFKSLVEAHDVTGIFRANIISCIKGTHRVKTAGGFIWKYKAA